MKNIAKTWDRSAALHCFMISALVIAILLPFSDKAFHLDDPMYIWAAQHIQSDPFDFYGFNANWFGVDRPMVDTMKNPPLVSYYLAFIISIFGLTERMVHVALMLPAVMTGLGTYFLAKKMCSRPLLASLIGTVTPVFILSATTVMCDVLMLSFWIWAIISWMKGLEKKSLPLLLLSGLLIAFSALSKYFGISLIPLLAAYSILKRQNIALWLPAVFFSIAILAGYQFLTFKLYGRGLLLDASSYAIDARTDTGLKYFDSTFTGLAFLGGCVITPLFYLSFFWNRKFLIAGLLLVISAVAALFFAQKIGPTSIFGEHEIRWDLVVQSSIFMLGGALILYLSLWDLFKHRDHESVLLALWVFGTFVFASFFNWTTSGRAVLPIAPAAAIILSRRLDTSALKIKTTYLLLPLIPALFISLYVTYADYDWANRTRSAAETIYARYGNTGKTVWFQGHWGFQYYMEGVGGKALDWSKTVIEQDDLLVIPAPNTNVKPLPRHMLPFLEEISSSPAGRLSIMSGKAGAGFYSSVWGALPYVIGPEFKDTYRIYYAKTPVRMAVR